MIFHVIFFFKSCSPNFFDMYHSKTSEITKEKIRADMFSPNGFKRAIICTNAAGMGVHFQNLYNTVHYGPTKDLDTLDQQMSRAGRDRTESNELVINKSNKEIG